MYKLRASLCTLCFIFASIPTAQAEVFTCVGQGLRVPGMENHVETWNGLAEIKPDNRPTVIIDTSEHTLAMGRSEVRKITNYEVIHNDFGRGFAADVPGLGGKLIVRYRENDEYFSVVIGDYEIAGICP